MLHKIRPLLEEFLNNSIANVIPGKRVTIDEITIGFQGHHKHLKQRCGKFKRAGDGFQVWIHCMLHGAAWRGVAMLTNCSVCTGVYWVLA